MTGKYDKPLFIDMPFGEALERYVGVDPTEIPENKKLKRRGAQGPPAATSSAKSEAAASNASGGEGVRVQPQRDQGEDDSKTE